MKPNLNHIALLFLAFSMPFFVIFFRLNLSSSNYGFFDIILMVPVYAWIYMLVWVSLLCFHILMSRRITFLHVLLFALFVQVMYPLSQYPMIIHRDAFYHGLSASQVLTASNTQVESLYPNLWPGAFIFWVGFSEVTGMDILTCNFIFPFLLSIVIVALLYSLGTRFLDRNWGGLAAMLYLVAGPYGSHSLLIDHFSPFQFAFVQLLLIVFFLSRMYDKDENNKNAFFMTMILSIFTVVISHSFTSIFLLLILISVPFFGEKTIVSRLRKVILNPLAILTAIMVILWWTLNPGFTGSTLDFRRVIDYLFTNFWRFFSTSKIAGTQLPIVKEPLPFFGVALRDYFLKPLVGGLVIISIAVVFWAKKFPLFKGVFLGTFSATILAYLIPSFMGRISQFQEFVVMLMVPTSFLFLIFWMRWKIALKAFVIVLPVLLVLSYLTMFTYSSEYEVAIKDWEISGCKFFVQSTYFWQPIVADSGTAILYKFYDYQYEPIYKFSTIVGLLEVDREWFDNSTFTQNYHYGTIIIRSFQQELTYSLYVSSFNDRQELWARIDVYLSNKTNLNRIYDNGFVQGYIP